MLRLSACRITVGNVSFRSSVTSVRSLQSGACLLQENGNPAAAAPAPRKWLYKYEKPLAKEAARTFIPPQVRDGVRAAELAALGARLGFDSKNPIQWSLFEEALVHTHKGSKNYKPGDADNQRLAFTGKRIIAFYVSELLYTNFPNLPGGTLGDLADFLTNREALVALASKLGIVQHVVVVNGDAQTLTSSVMSQATRAIVGAMYYSRGPESAREFIRNFIFQRVNDVDIPETLKMLHPRITLAHLLKAEGVPTYKLTSSAGKTTHLPTFTFDVVLNARVIGSGTGSSIFRAQDDAARSALAKHYSAQLKDVPLPSETEEYEMFHAAKTASRNFKPIRESEIL